MNEDIKVTFDSPEELNVELDAGVVQYGKLQVGTTTTGAAGTKAKVENVGSSGNAILNFTIPKGDKGEKGDKGNKGDAGAIKFIVVAELPTKNIDESAIYMKPSSNQEENNYYEEFIYTDGKWESLGAAQVKIDLEPYATKEELNQLQDNIEDVFNGNEAMGSIVVDDISCKNINSSGVEAGKYNMSTGVKNTDTTCMRNATPVEVESNTEYIFSNNGTAIAMNVLEYDSSNKFLQSSVIDINKSFVTLNNTKYINYFRSTSNTNKLQLEKGNVITNYVPHKEFSNKQIYSTSEQVIGVWHNGKPLYRQVIILTPNISATTTSTTFDVPIANVDEYIFDDATMIKDVSTGSYSYTFPFVHSDANLNIGGYLTPSATKIAFNIRKGNNIGLYSIRLVLKYTKTTD